MASLTYRRKNGKVYVSLEESFRDARGRPRKRVLRSLGAVGGKRRKKPLVAALDILMSLALFGGRAAKGELKQRSFREKADPHGRLRQAALSKIREANRLHGIDDSSLEAFNASWSRLNADRHREYAVAVRAAWGEYHAELARQRARAPMTGADAKDRDRGKAWADLLARSTAQRAAERCNQAKYAKGSPTDEDEANFSDMMQNVRDQISRMDAERTKAENAADPNAREQPSEQSPSGAEGKGA